MAGSKWGVIVRHGSREFTRCSRLLLFALLGLQLCLAEGPTPYPSSRAKLSPPPRPARPSSANDGLPALYEERDLWHQSLIRDRKLEQRLRAAARQLAAGEINDGLASLQSVLNHAEDGFVRLESLPTPLGAHHVAGRMLGSLPPESLRIYQSLYGGEAEKLLQAARAKDDQELFGEIVRRFYHTTAGFEACDWLANRAMDRGSFALAAAYWRRILADPVHEQRVRSMQRLKAAYCLQRNGQIVLSQQMMEKLDAGPFLVAGRSVQPQQWLAQTAPAGAGPLEAMESPVAFGSPDRNGVAKGSAPLVRYPLWTVPLADAQSRHLESLVTAWETNQLANALPVGVAHFPLVTAGCLVFRDFEGIRAVDLDTGKLRWFHRSATSLSRDIPPLTVPPVEGNTDPANLTRLLVGNCALGMLSSDGRRLFAIDQLESRWTQQGAFSGQFQDAASANRQSNVLIALDLAQETAVIDKPLWTAGGPVDPQQPKKPLAGHFFLGPPLPVENRLFAVTEGEQQLNVVCLKPETGEVVWSQAICSVSLPIQSDPQRYYLACSPSYADGVLVCPTQSGVLAGLDPLSGTLLWGYSYEDPEQRQQMWAWPNSVRRRYAHPGYPSLPAVQGDSIVYLPAYSESIHCVDLHTGRHRWRARREDLEQAMEYVGTVTDEVVLIVGRRRCRGLSLQSGEEQWSLALGSVPAGRGARVGSNYLVPLAEGGIVNLDVATGRRIGLALPNDGLRPGNLVVSGDVVVSMGRTEISAFPQAHSVVRSQNVVRSLRDRTGGSRSDPPTLLAAEVDLALGQTTQAKVHLEAILHAVPPAGSALMNESVAQAEGLLRDVLFRELQTATDNPLALLDRLAPLVKTPEQRGRYLLERANFELERGNPAELLAIARELVAVDLKTPLKLDGDPARSVAVDASVRRLFSRAQNDMADDEQLAELTSQIELDLKAAVDAGDLPLLRRLTFIYGSWPQADKARVQLARLLWEQGAYQEAELFLLDSRKSSVPATAGEATRLLAELWNERGLFHEAGLLLDEIATRFADIDVASGRTGSAYLSAFPRTKPAWDAYRRLAPPAWSGGRVKITEERWFNTKLQELYNGNGITYLTTPRGASFDLFDKGRTTPPDAGRLVAVDRQTGAELEEIKTPSRYYYPLAVQQAYVGHFFPLGSPWAIHGVSLLERKVAWTTLPFGMKNATDLAKVGPAGPGYCALQCKQHLAVVDPVLGHVLWRRNDLDGMTGLMVDPNYGLFGDAEALVLFAADKATYTVFDTATGEELRRGKLDIDPRQTQNRKVFGRFLFYITNGSEKKLLRIWDPLSDRIVWEEEADDILDVSILAGAAPATKAYAVLSPTDELAYVTTTGRIRVIDGRTGDTRLDAPLDPSQTANLSALRVFSDAGRYYVNLQRAPLPGEAVTQNSFSVSDALLPIFPVQGDVCAFDRTTQQAVWQRPFGNRSVLQLAEFRLPVLVTLCRVRRENQLALQVEVLDCRTGDVRATRDNLLGDRLLQLSYERDPGRIELRGARTEIRIEFAEGEDRVHESGTSRADRANW